MAPLEEPTVAELIRRLGDKVDSVGVNVARLEGTVSQYVTQEQRTADRELAAEQDRQRDARIAAQEQRSAAIVRWAWTSVIGPASVGVLIWLLSKGTS